MSKTILFGKHTKKKHIISFKSPKFIQEISNRNYKTLLLFLNITIAPYAVPVGIRCQNDVVSTSMRRHHVASPLIRRHFHVMCPLGCLYIHVLSAYEIIIIIIIIISIIIFNISSGHFYRLEEEATCQTD